MAELDIRTAALQAQTMARYVDGFTRDMIQGFSEKNAREFLGKTLDHLQETAAMLGNVADRLAATQPNAAPAAEVVAAGQDLIECLICRKFWTGAPTEKCPHCGGPELVTVGVMHKCRTDMQFDQCVNCGAMAEDLSNPCKAFISEASKTISATASPPAGQEQAEAVRKDRWKWGIENIEACAAACDEVAAKARGAKRLGAIDCATALRAHIPRLHAWAYQDAQALAAPAAAIDAREQETKTPPVTFELAHKTFAEHMQWADREDFRGLSAATREHLKDAIYAAVSDALASRSEAPEARPTIEMSPEFTDTARAALLWVLWHHQGGSCKVGQPIRFALGMGQHDHLNEHQIAEAKRWEALQPAARPNAAGQEKGWTDEQIMALWNPYCDGEKRGGVVQFARKLLALSARGQGSKA